MRTIIALVAPRITWILLAAACLDGVARLLTIILPRWDQAPDLLIRLHFRGAPTLDRVVLLLALLKIVFLLPEFLPRPKSKRLAGRILALVGLAYLGTEVISLASQSMVPDTLLNGIICFTAILVGLTAKKNGSRMARPLMLSALALTVAAPQIWRLSLIIQGAGDGSELRESLRQFIDIACPLAFFLAGILCESWRGIRTEKFFLTIFGATALVYFLLENTASSVVKDLSCLWLSTLPTAGHALLLGGLLAGSFRIFSLRWRSGEGVGVLLLAATGLRATPGAQLPAIMCGLFMIWLACERGK